MVFDKARYLARRNTPCTLSLYGLSYHFYADDTHLHTSFKPKEDAVKAQSLSLIENCLTDIEGWTRTNMFKLNSDKTEVMLFISKHNAIRMKNVTVCFGDSNITSVKTLRNLGAPSWSSGSVLDHRSLPPVFESRRGISEGCFVFRFVSLPLEVARPI